MNAEVLFGGKIRFAILEALMEANEPMTAYQIAIAKGLDPAATYRSLAEFSGFGIVESEVKARNQTFYVLSRRAGKAASAFLWALKQRRSEPFDLEKWLSPEVQAERITKIMQVDTKELSTSRFARGSERKGVNELLSKRASGELSALITSSRIAFNELFERKDGTFILKNK